MAKTKRANDATKSTPGFFLFNPRTGKRKPIALKGLHFGTDDWYLEIEGNKDGTLRVSSGSDCLTIAPFASNIVDIRNMQEDREREAKAAQKLFELWKRNGLDPARRR